MLFNYKYEILKYNLVNKNNRLVPNYDLSKEKAYFDLYISPEKSICIIGRLDNNYICWCSITKLNDREINAGILRNYLNIFSKDDSGDYYNKMEPLISILGCEAYLRLSPDLTVRDLYLRCMGKCSQLYNRYITDI